MTRILLGLSGGCALAALTLFWMWDSERADNARLRANIAALETIQEREEETKRVLNAHIDRLEELSRSDAEIIRQLSKVEGGDAPLDDYFNDAARILWPR